MARPEHVTTVDPHRERARPASLHPNTAARMKHRSPSEQHHGEKRPRAPAAAASTSPPDGMEDSTPSNPRELTQNPLKKIWMPCKNGLPEKHISQRKGAYDDVATNNELYGYSTGSLSSIHQYVSRGASKVCLSAFPFRCSNLSVLLADVTTNTSAGATAQMRCLTDV